MTARRSRWSFAALAGLGACLVVAAAAGAQVASGERLHAFRADHMVLDAAVRGSTVLAGTQSGQLDVFDWRLGEALDTLLATRPLAGQVFPPTLRSVAISPSGELCAVVLSDDKLRLLRLDADASARSFFTLEIPGPLVARFLDDGRLLIGDIRGELALFDVGARREVFRRQLEYDPIYVVAPSPDGSRAAVAFRSSRIQIVSADDGETLRVLRGHRDSVFGLAWLDDETLASAGKDKHLLLWDLRRDEPQPQVLYAGDHYVTALAADPRGGRLALPLADHQVGLIRLSDRRVTHRLRGHTAPIQVLLFVDGGERLISAGNDARVLVWNVAG